MAGKPGLPVSSIIEYFSKGVMLAISIYTALRNGRGGRCRK